MSNLKITLLITDLAAAIHVGGDVERRAIQFEMPAEIEAEIFKLKRENSHVQPSLVITEIAETEPQP